MSNKYDYLIGTELKPSRFTVKKKKLLAYAESIGATQAVYNDPENPHAHPAYANSFSLDCLNSITGLKSPDGSPLIKNPMRMLHGGQGYKFPKNSPPLEDKDKLLTIPKIIKAEVKESNQMLVIEVEAKTTISKSKDESKIGKHVCDSILTILAMPGAY